MLIKNPCSLVLIILVLLFPITASPQTNLYPENTKVFWGKYYDLETFENFAFIATMSGGIRIVDISDEMNPQEVSKIWWDNSYISEIEIVDSMLIFTADINRVENLIIYNISNPSNPQELCQYPLNREVYSFHTDGQTIVLERDQGFTLIDISDPVSPVEIGQIEDDERYYNRDDILFIEEDYILIAHERGLTSYDISDPGNPVELDNYSGYEEAHEIKSNGNILYLLDSDCLHVLDICDLNNISEVTSLNVQEFPEYYSYWGHNFIEMKNSKLYVVVGGIQNDNSIICTIDITDPSHPVKISESLVNSNALNIIALDDVMLVLSEYNGLNFYSMENELLTEKMLNFNNSIKFKEVVSHENKLTVFSRHLLQSSTTIQVIDISDPVNPEITGTGYFKDQFKDVMSPSFGDSVLVNVKDHGLAFINIGNLSGPSMDDIYIEPADIEKAIIKGEYLYYLQNHDEALKSVVITTVDDPFQAINSFHGSFSFSLMDDYLILVGYNRKSISVYDVSDPESPVELGSYGEDVEDIKDVIAADGKAYISYVSYGAYGAEEVKVKCFDLANPDHPILAHIWNSYSWEPNCLIPFENFLIMKWNYLCEEGNALIFDMTNPYNPEMTHILKYSNEEIDFYPYGGLENNGYLYLFGDNVVQVFDINGIVNESTDEENQAIPNSVVNIYPNPFNPTLNVGINITVPGKMKVSLFNINGQLVRTLADGSFLKGNHVFQYNGSHLSSGVYFVNVSVPGQLNQIEKVTLIK